MMGYLQQWMFEDSVTVSGSCTRFVRHVSVTPIIVDPIAVADAPCERELTQLNSSYTVNVR